MSKFDAIFKRIEEGLPVTPPAAGVTPKPTTTNPNQQLADPKIVQELINAKNEQQVNLALQKLQAAQQATQQKTGQAQQQTNQPAV